MKRQLSLIVGILFGMSIQTVSANMVKPPATATSTQTAAAKVANAPLASAQPSPGSQLVASNQATVASAPAKSAPVALAVAAPVAQSTWRVHAGSAYTDSQGNLWSADENFTGGTGTAATT